MAVPDGNASDSPTDSVESSDPALAVRSERSTLRRVTAIWLIFGVAGLAVIVLMLELFVARRLPDLTRERLEAAQARWNASGLASYDLDLQILGERPAPVHVEVRGGIVTEVTIDGRPPSPWTRDTWTVAGQFETLERELVLAEDPVHQMDVKSGTRLRLRCEFDPQFGYPREYQRTVYGEGPDVYWRVTSFIVR